VRAFEGIEVVCVRVRVHVRARARADRPSAIASGPPWAPAHKEGAFQYSVYMLVISGRPHCCERGSGHACVQWGPVLLSSRNGGPLAVGGRCDSAGKGGVGWGGAAPVLRIGCVRVMVRVRVHETCACACACADRPSAIASGPPWAPAREEGAFQYSVYILVISGRPGCRVHDSRHACWCAMGVKCCLHATAAHRR
jgi:hypothetical protein